MLGDDDVHSLLFADGNGDEDLDRAVRDIYSAPGALIVKPRRNADGAPPGMRFQMNPEDPEYVVLYYSVMAVGAPSKLTADQVRARFPGVLGDDNDEWTTEE